MSNVDQIQLVKANGTTVVNPATEEKQDTANTSLAGILTQADFDTKTGSLTETAPATDTASSGLNGRLQRVAQRISALILQIPAALGQLTMAGSMSVTMASDQSKIETIDTTHKMVHAGKYFSGGYYNASIADTTTIALLIQNGASVTHAVLSSTMGGESKIEFFEGTTFSAAGTAVTMSNHNRSSATTFVGTVTSQPTVTANGTQINGTGLIPGGGKNAAVGGSFDGFGSEFDFAINTNYLVLVTNVSGGTIKGDVIINCYQP